MRKHTLGGSAPWFLEHPTGDDGFRTGESAHEAELTHELMARQSQESPVMAGTGRRPRRSER